MIPKGSYQAVAKEFVFGRAGTGAEQIVVSFEIASGDLAGQRIAWRGYFTEKTEERTLESLEAAGWDGNPPLASLGGLGSKACVIVIDHEEGQDGKTYAKVQWVNTLGGGLSVKEKLQTAEIANLEGRLKGLMLERRGKRQAPPPNGAPPAAKGRGKRQAPLPNGRGQRSGYDDADYGSGDDDIPF